MDVMRFRTAMSRALLLIALLSIPMHVYALGFGAIVLESHLNQKLQAHIPLLLNTSDDINTIRVELASANEYKQLGLRWQAELALIRVSLHGKHSEQPRVELSSAEWIHVPMLSIVLKAKKTGRGTYFKHYQLLLDAVEVLALRPQMAALKPVSGQAGASVVVNDITAVPDDGDWARTWRYGPVRSGDSLSEIAYRLRVDKRFTNRQVMLSLYEKNRHAFGDGDINRLIKGVWLKVPSAGVVQQFSGPAAMQKLSQLLAKQEPAEKNTVKAKDRSAPQQKSTVSAKAAAGTSLRYSGKISMQGPEETKTLTSLKQGFAQQFGKLHQRMMAGKLQMSKLDETVSDLNVSIQVVKQDIQGMKRDISIIKTRTIASPASSWVSWQLVLIVALMLMIMVLLVMVLRKDKDGDDALPVTGEAARGMPVKSGLAEERRDEDQYRSAIQNTEPESRALQSKGHRHEQGSEIEFIPGLQSADSVYEAGSNVSNHTSTKVPELRLNPETAPLAEAVIQLLNQIEESLGQCEFEQAEGLLQRVDEQWPDSLRASALKAQLYYETDRQTEMHDLINTISSTSDEQRWEQFCYFLPSHVWNACFGDAASPPRPDQA